MLMILLLSGLLRTTASFCAPGVHWQLPLAASSRRLSTPSNQFGAAFDDDSSALRDSQDVRPPSQKQLDYAQRLSVEVSRDRNLAS